MVKVSCQIIGNFPIAKHFFVPSLFMLLLVYLATRYAINNKHASVIVKVNVHWQALFLQLSHEREKL